MNSLPAHLGWLWVKQGWQYFKRQPLEFFVLFLGYLFFILAVGLIPYVGQIVAFVLTPLFTLSFMQACKEIDEGARAHPKLLLFGFRSPQFVKLVQLGILYLIAGVTALAASTLIDNGVFWQVFSGKLEITSKHVQDSNMLLAMLCAMVIYLPAMMGFWFAAPLIAWQQMPLLKAIFYSFFATLRASNAFLMYGVAWFIWAGLLPTVISAIVAIVTGNPYLAILFLVPFPILLTIILYCSFYPTYKSVFGASLDTAPSKSV